MNKCIIFAVLAFAACVAAAPAPAFIASHYGLPLSYGVAPVISHPIGSLSGPSAAAAAAAAASAPSAGYVRNVPSYTVLGGHGDYGLGGGYGGLGAY